MKINWFNGGVTICFFVLSFLSAAQLPYTTAAYAYDSIMNLSYGSAVDYAGNSEDLQMDIYKPRNSYCNRPIAVLIHGGAWVAGSKEDADMVYLSRYLARRGFVVANINYRLGTHKAANYDMFALCNTNLSAPCAYISDSAEVYRANYRAMQDTKGAIRYMKSRYQQDSSDYANVYLVGESAGGFIALTAAFLNDPSEKPLNCGAIADAPNPDADMNTYGCVPNPISLVRPDLGSVDGELHLGSFDAEVQGAGSFFGGLIQSEIVTAGETAGKALYMFHQGSDVVVHYNYGRLLGRTSWECYAQVNLCQNYFFYPFAWGSKGLDGYFQSISAQFPNYQADIIENYEYLNDCLDNPVGHSIDARELRAGNMVNVFAQQLADNGNVPSTPCNAGLGELSQEGIYLYPNPVSETLYIRSDRSNDAAWKLFDNKGQVLLKGHLENGAATLNMSTLSPAVYFLRIQGATPQIAKVVKY